MWLHSCPRLHNSLHGCHQLLLPLQRLLHAQLTLPQLLGEPELHLLLLRLTDVRC